MTGAKSGEDGWVELADAIEMVRQQLVAAQMKGRRVVAGQVVTFSVGKVSLEFTGEVKKTVGGSAGVKFWVVTADAKGERARTASHKIVIELSPQTVEGQSFVVSDELDNIPGS